MTLKIETSVRRGFTVFALSGHAEAEHIAELKRLLDPETHSGPIVLDLKELRLADRITVRFLACCEANGVKLEGCPGYIREWIEKERKV